MEFIRAAYRSLLFLIFSVLTLLIFILGIPFSKLIENGRVRWKNRLISRWAGGVARLIGLEMNIKGAPPEPPFFMISNHLSYIDVILFWKHLKTTFIAKSDIKKWPLFGFAGQVLGVIFIDRENRRDLNRVNSLVETNMNPHQGVILFPEGTSSKGAQILPFKSSLLFYPASQKLPVYYASISYNITNRNGKEAWKDICWWGDMDFLGHFWGLLKIKSWSVTVQFGSSPVTHQNRKKLTQLLHQKVAEEFIPTFSK